MTSSATQNPTAPLIVLAAGGTGGHIFPAEALAGELLARGFRVALFTDSRGRAFGGQGSDVEVHYVRAAGFGTRITGKIRGTVELGMGWFQARKLLGELSPACVVGFGGYPSVPTCLAAVARNIPLVLHEQNAVLGRANRLLTPWAQAIALSFPGVAGLSEKDGQRSRLTGNPVRQAILGLRNAAFQAPGPDGDVEVLVIGGSQGARVFSDVVPDGLRLLPDALKARLKLAQQCRPEDIDRVRAAWAGSGIAVELKTFFDDLPQRLASAHLVISRAGASSVAELTVAGRPSILVPLPQAMDDHQKVNAESLADAGAAWLMPQAAFTAETLAARIEALMTNETSLANAAASARSLGRPDAAPELADCVIETAGLNGAKTTGEVAA